MFFSDPIQLYSYFCCFVDCFSLIYYFIYTYVPSFKIDICDKQCLNDQSFFLLLSAIILGLQLLLNQLPVSMFVISQVVLLVAQIPVSIHVIFNYALRDLENTFFLFFGSWCFHVLFCVLVCVQEFLIGCEYYCSSQRYSKTDSCRNNEKLHDI